MDKEKKIFVFADFQPYHEEIIGTIYVSQTRGKEFYSFEYDQKWLEKGNMILDPDLQMYKGRQYIHDDKKIFGVFADSCPDRWGQRLMKRREELRAKNAGEKPRKLLDSDYLLGVYDEYLVEPLAQVLVSLGVKRGMVVYGMDKLDEISMSASTKICEIKDGWFRTTVISPEDFGFERCTKEDLKGGTPEENAKIVRDILGGQKGNKRNAVLMNAGASLYIGGKADSMKEGIELAAEIIDSGKALETLDKLIEVSNS